jgi:AraC family ethanolamine operon transcriptional activator
MQFRQVLQNIFPTRQQASMSTHTFTSPEAHVAAVQNSNLRMALVGKTRAPWTMTSLAMPDVRAQWGQAGGGTLIEGTVAPGGVMLFVPTRNVRVMRMNGCRFDAQTFRLQVPGDEICLSSTDWHGWFSMFIPKEVFADWIGTDATPIAPSSRFIRVPWKLAEAFQRVVAQLGSIVQREPTAFESSAALHTTARKLTELVHEAILRQPTTTTQAGRQSIPRRQIFRVVMDFIDRRDGEYLTVADLAAAAGVSERTLREAFHEYFGMGPARYLKFRALNLIRKALQNADPSVTTVTGVATRLGVWELGRMAHDYQILFGEFPSATLHHVR